MPEPPNIVLIVSDTFRRDHLGVYGNRRIRTPNLDRFAAEAVVFDHHLVASFPTMPARADLLTGRFSFTFMGWEPLPAHLPTLPGLLSEAGYLTMGIVDTPFFIRDGYGYDRGFDDFIWVRGQGDDTRPHERADARASWVREGDRLVARTGAAADEWLERHYRERFFLYVDTWDPHEPWDAPPYYAELYRPGYDGRTLYPAYGKWREAGLSEDDVALAHATYCGEVTMVDRWLGHLLGKLDVLGVADRTIVLFTSDHGFFFGEHGYFGKADWIHDPGATLSAGAEVPEWFSASWLLTIGRSPLYRELTRIPLAVRGPGLSPGRRSALTTAPDIPATILDLAGLEPPAAEHGRPFTAVLLGSADEHRPLVVSSWPLYFAKGELTSAVDGRTRQVASSMPITVTTRELSLVVAAAEETPELYDLAADPGETTNVWEERADDGSHLLEEALGFLEACGTADRLLSPRRDALRALTARPG
jgi:arylsulfatase A-like enzyme